MSSGKIEEKAVYFEINCNGVLGSFTLSLIEGDDINPDKVLMKMSSTTNGGSGSSASSTNAVFIPKSQTKVLSHFFKHAAEVMDTWYKDEK